jgi:hypothetical protein
VIYCNAEKIVARISVARPIQPSQFVPHCQSKYLPGHISVTFEENLTDFEIVYLVEEFWSKKINGWDSKKATFVRTGNDSYGISLPENCNLDHITSVLERNPFVRSVDRVGLFRACKSTHRAGDLKQHLYDPMIEQLMPPEIPGDMHLALTAKNTRSEAVKKNSKIPSYSANSDHRTRKPSSADRPVISYKSTNRSKAKIYKYRDRNGRLVITNYYFPKRKTAKE